MNNLACHIPYNLLPSRGTEFPRQLSAPTINGAANEFAEKLNVGKDMTTMATITTIVVVSHALLDVKLPGGGVVPTTSNFLGSGMPGIGKTKSFDGAMRVPREFQKQQIEERKMKSAKYKVKDSIWYKQRMAMLDQVPVNLSDNSINEEIPDGFTEQLTSQLEAKLIEHEKSRPQKPKTLRLMTEDATIEFIHVALDEYPALTVYTTEFGTVAKSRLMNHEEQLCSFWSGSTVMINRKTGESFEIDGARVSLVAWGQPGVVGEHLKGKGKHARNNGLMSRCLLFIPQAPLKNQPPTFESEPCEKQGLYIEKYEARISELLLENQKHFDNPDLARKVIEFTPEAAAWFEQIKCEINQHKTPGWRFANAHDHASRLAEQIARVAALMQYFENPESGITISTLQDAINICAYCSDCFLTIFDPPPQEFIDAQMLNEWMNHNLRSNTNLRLVYKNHIRQFGPNSLREKNRLNHALLFLQQQGMIGMFMWGRHHVINLYPNMPIDNATIAYFLGSPKK